MAAGVQELVAQSVALSTRLAYRAVWPHWRLFLHTLVNLPAAISTPDSVYVPMSLRNEDVARLVSMFSTYLLRTCRMKPDRVLFMLSALKYNLSTRSMSVEVWHSSTLLDAVRRGLARQPTSGTATSNRRLPATQEMVLLIHDTCKHSHYPVRRARAAAVILAYCCLFRPSEYLYDSGPRPHILLAGQIEFECRAPRGRRGSTNTVFHSLSTVHTVPWHRIMLMRINITSAKNINRRVGARLWFSAESTGAIHVVRVMYDWACLVPHVDSAPVFSWPSPPGVTPTRTYLWYRDFHETIRLTAGHFGFDHTQWLSKPPVRRRNPTPRCRR
jgi:hypothetical protein